MNVLFLTLLDFESLNESNIYTDLLREFTKCGHKVYAISPVEKRKKQETRIIYGDRSTILKLRIGDIQQTNLIKKGVSTICIEPQLIAGIKKYFGNITFDLVIYSTPPITFCNAIRYIKERDGAKSYLLLKDIFPQNAVDIGLMVTNGIRGVIYKYFRKKEKDLYSISNYIGCMSQANANYLIKNNPEVNPNKVGICPNSIDVVDKSIDDVSIRKIRDKYNIPLNKKVFVYGGNLGKPQGIDFLIECLKSQHQNEDVYFIIVGNGTEYFKLEEYIQKYDPENVVLMNRLPKDDYDNLVAACDVGMIFLDSRFTIPNFPSRLLGYMQAKIPVLACTDSNTDIGKTITEGGFGWWCESTDIEAFCNCINDACNANYSKIKEKEFEYLKEHYSSRRGFEIIMNVLDIERR